MDETQSLTAVSTKLERIAEVARRHPKTALTTLAHHIDVDWLLEAHRRTRKDGATGIDRMTADEYAKGLEGRLVALLERVKTGQYRAPPVRRVHIPKNKTETRALGIPTFEDKVLQRAVAMILEAIYEQEMYACSYGFRPGRSARQAVEAFRDTVTMIGGGWVVELDIRKYFDTIDHEQLRTVLSQRVRDGQILRLIGKWLNAGVMEKGQLSHSKAGTPQGGVISPILANIFLHEVLDAWFHEQVRPRLRGRAWLVRYADDAVMLFEYGDDARRLMQVLPKRFARYGLTLHPDKTRQLDFRRPDRCSNQRREGEEGTKPLRSFTFLGFTHHWGKSLAGKWVVRVRTAKERFRKGLQAIAEWCAGHRHAPLREQQQALNRQLRGHYNYFGRVGNRGRLWTYLRRVERVWKQALERRSQRRLTWRRMRDILQLFPLLTPRLPAQPPQLPLPFGSPNKRGPAGAVTCVQPRRVVLGA